MVAAPFSQMTPLPTGLESNFRSLYNDAVWGGFMIRRMSAGFGTPVEIRISAKY